eukprot:658041-Alexandrium_andersonii.AAC.1
MLLARAERLKESPCALYSWCSPRPSLPSAAIYSETPSAAACSATDGALAPNLLPRNATHWDALSACASLLGLTGPRARTPYPSLMSPSVSPRIISLTRARSTSAHGAPSRRAKRNGVR